MSNQIAMFMQIMKAPNKMAMVENLIKQNPQLNNAWQMAQQLSQNNNKHTVNRTGTSGISPNLITEMPKISRSKSKIIIASGKETFFFIKILQ